MKVRIAIAVNAKGEIAIYNDSLLLDGRHDHCANKELAWLEGGHVSFHEVEASYPVCLGRYGPRTCKQAAGHDGPHTDVSPWSDTEVRDITWSDLRPSDKS